MLTGKHCVCSNGIVMLTQKNQNHFVRLTKEEGTM